MAIITTVIFDLDGVLIDSEPIWSEVRHGFALAHGGAWADDADARMMGMATHEWARYMHDELQIPIPVEAIATGVIDEMHERYRTDLPLLPDAVETVGRLAGGFTLGLASSSPASLIEVALESSGLTGSFTVTMSTEEIGIGKPAPDIYLSVARRLDVEPKLCTAIEDSTNGLRSALAAGMRVIATPKQAAPPDPSVLSRADAVVERLADITCDLIDPPREIRS